MVQPGYGVVTPEEHDAAKRRNLEWGFYAWCIGTLGFAGVEMWARNGRTTFSQAVRRIFVVRHPAGRVALGAGMGLLYAHFVRQKAVQGVSEALLPDPYPKVERR